MSDAFTELFMQFLRDKKTAVKNVAEDVERIQSLNKGLATFLQNFGDAELDNKNICKQLKTIMTVMKTQNAIMSKMMLLMLAYINGPSFDQDVANLLASLGKSDEAVEAMLKSKTTKRK